MIKKISGCRYCLFIKLVDEDRVLQPDLLRVDLECELISFFVDGSGFNEGCKDGGWRFVYIEPRLFTVTTSR